MDADFWVKAVPVIAGFVVQVAMLAWWAAGKNRDVEDLQKRVHELEGVLTGDKKVEWALWKKDVADRIVDLENAVGDHRLPDKRHSRFRRSDD